MAPLAGLLQAVGHHVEGVDSGLYPPMSTLLDELGIPVRIGWNPDLIPDRLDRVIIGNAVPRSNPEVTAILERGVPFLSQAEAVAHYVLARGPSSLVVAGTHGKTTTSSLLAWILESVDTDPSYLIGGLPSWNPRGFRLGRGPWMVLEGDEYNTAFFDRGPSFSTTGPISSSSARWSSTTPISTRIFTPCSPPFAPERPRYPSPERLWSTPGPGTLWPRPGMRRRRW